VQAQDEHPARIDGATPDAIQTEREFMDALRALRVRSGLSYRDIVSRLSRAAPRHAMAKSTLAALFAKDALPRRPGQLTAIVDVLGAELAEPADVSARYLAAWTRLMTARSAQPGTAQPGTAQPGTPAGPRQAPPPVAPAAAVAWRPVVHTTPDEAKSDFEKAGGLWPLLIGGTVLSVLTWLPFADGPVPFWAIWLAWCGPILLFTAIAALFRQRPGSSSAGLPAEYLRYEQRTIPHRPGRY
jgi:hypothetical protein